MLPGMIEMVIGVIPSGVVTDPTFAIVDMRSVGMPFLLLELLILLHGSGILHSRRTVRGNILMTSDFRSATGLMLMLRERRERKYETNREYTDQFFHIVHHFQI